VSLMKPILGLDDAFGQRSKSLRTLQFKLYDVYENAGFSEVIPPLVERPEALNSGAGSFLSDQTIVFSDPADAGLLAIRPDMTPQIARIVASRLPKEEAFKLYYSGQVMLARPDSRTGSRQQWQTGIECLGLAGVEGDVEVIHLAALSMATAGFSNPVLQVGHMGIIHALIAGSHASVETWVQLIARYSPEDLKAQIDQESFADATIAALSDLSVGKADTAWLKANLGLISEDFDVAANELLTLVSTVKSKLSGEVDIVIDAAVTPRFLYHNGMVFSGFASGSAHALLHGGRYDTMMAAHGRDMPATGFSFDLWTWLDS